MINQAQVAARLGRSDLVYDIIERMVTKKYVLPSFMMSYWPGFSGFGFDPVGTLPDVINSSLVFAWDGTVDLLPALPKEWPKGSISGVLLRGQIQVRKLAWDVPAGTVDLELISGRDQTITVQLPPGVPIRSATSGDRGVFLPSDDSRPHCRKLTMPKGKPVQVSLRIAPDDFSTLWKNMAAKP
jgi:hypothetical protein